MAATPTAGRQWKQHGGHASPSATAPPPSTFLPSSPSHSRPLHPLPRLLQAPGLDQPGGVGRCAARGRCHVTASSRQHAVASRHSQVGLPPFSPLEVRRPRVPHAQASLRSPGSATRAHSTQRRQGRHPSPRVLSPSVPGRQRGTTAGRVGGGSPPASPPAVADAPRAGLPTTLPPANADPRQPPPPPPSAAPSRPPAPGMARTIGIPGEKGAGLGQGGTGCEAPTWKGRWVSFSPKRHRTGPPQLVRKQRKSVWCLPTF